MKDLLASIVQALTKGEDLVIATIVSHAGSTPRTSGSKMVVARDGRTVGTIGGGLVEAQATAAAAEVFASGGVLVRTFDLTGPSAESVDMICGGRLEVLLEFLPADRTNLRLFEALQRLLREGRRGCLVTNLPKTGAGRQRPMRCLLTRDGEMEGECRFVQAHRDLIRDQVQTKGYPFLLSLGEDRLFVEPWSAPSTLILFGAGHVSQHTAALAARVGFRTVVTDDRAEFANRTRFPEADEIRVLASFDVCLDGLEIDRESYLVIVTRGHRHDLTVLRQVLRTEAGYIGMIGSKRKRDALYTSLKKEGVTSGELERVHCPIGITINAETPEEIAVSILAEIIKVRAANRNA